MTASLLASAQAHLDMLQPRAHVPFSANSRTVVVLLRSGAWIPGVRIESASYALTITALSNAITTAYTLGHAEDMVGVVSSTPLSDAEQTYLQAIDAFRTPTFNESYTACWQPKALPNQLEDAVDPTTDAPLSTADGIETARDVAQYAHIPESSFPVGAILVSATGAAFPGVNVEHPDWNRILCAERNALSTAYAYGHTNYTALYLSCPKAANGSPCGACRQVLAERATDAVIYMDRHAAPPEETSPRALLPAFFNSSDLVAD